MKILARPVLDFQETANYKAMKFKPFLEFFKYKRIF